MFSAFFYLLRARGLDVSLNEWLTLMEALEKGLAQSSLTSFYYLAFRPQKLPHARRGYGQYHKHHLPPREGSL